MYSIDILLVYVGVESSPKPSSESGLADFNAGKHNVTLLAEDVSLLKMTTITCKSSTLFTRLLCYTSGYYYHLLVMTICNYTDSFHHVDEELKKSFVS